MMEKLFRLSENNTSVRTEISAGITTFLTMAYIVVVQPLVLSGRMFGFDTGMDFGSVMTATCISAAVATIIMALYANYPIAQAPGMGENFFFVFSVLPATMAAGFRENSWQAALGIVFVSGVLFLVLSIIGVREALINAISPSMKNAMAVGIGIFIAFIGLQNAGLIITSATIVPGTVPPVLSPNTLVRLNTHFASPDLIVFFFGIMLTAALHVRGVRGSILWGILSTAVFAALLKAAVLFIPELASISAVASSKLVNEFKIAESIVSLPPSIAPTFMKMKISAAFIPKLIPFVVIFLFMDVFDTIGTLVGVGEQAGFIKDNRLPRAGRAMLSDAAGTVLGACIGTSTVTSFIESSAGVERGGRTGLTSLTVGIFFLLALFFSPLVNMLGSYAAITAPALVIVGAMMIRNICKIDFNDYSESVPAFLTIVGIPLTYSIADGLSLGFISYPLIKLLGGKRRDAGWLMYLLAAILLAYIIFVRRVAG